MTASAPSAATRPDARASSTTTTRSRASRRRGGSSTRLTLEVVDAEDPDADQAEVALLRAEGSRGPDHAAAGGERRGVGLVELTFARPAHR